MSNLIQYIGEQEGLFLPVLSTDSIQWEKEKQFAIQAFQGNKFLSDTAMKNMGSLQNAIINVASIGISLNPANKHAYLVPRDGKICLDISYMGLLHLAMESGSIVWGQAKLVHASDSYQSNGLDKAPNHNYNPFLPKGDRGAVIGAYCTVKLPCGDYLTDEMSFDDITAIQNASRAKNGPWKNHWGEMARKTVVKRASKYWPVASRLNQAIECVNSDGGEGLAKTEKDVTPVPDDNYQSKLESLFSGKDPKNYLPWLSGGLGRDITSLSDISPQESIDVIKAMENASK